MSLLFIRQDCDYSPFMHIIDPPLPNCNLDTVRAYLCNALMCDPITSTICRIPVDEQHNDKLLVIYPTLLSPELLEIHKSFSNTFRDMELKVRQSDTQLSKCFSFRSYRTGLHFEAQVGVETSASTHILSCLRGLLRIFAILLACMLFVLTRELNLEKALNDISDKIDSKRTLRAKTLPM
jgi:hypothetical protein